MESMNTLVRFVFGNVMEQQQHCIHFSCGTKLLAAVPILKLLQLKCNYKFGFQVQGV
jgi:hypothetical protein